MTSPLPDRLLRASWPLFLVLLPITSPVLLGGHGGAVRPPSAILALLLLPLVLWQAGSVGGALLRDQAVRWVLAFAGWAVVSGAVLLAVAAPDDLPGKATANGLYAKAVLSLVLGLAVYLLARDRLRSAEAVWAAVPWLLGGLAVSVALAFAQVLTLGPMPGAREPVAAVSAWFSSAYSEPVPLMGRGHGLAYEPSYLASQLVLLALPLGLALLAAERWRLGLGAIALALAGCLVAGSRLGLLAAGMVLLVGVATLLWQGRRRAALVAIIMALAVVGAVWPLVRGNAYVAAGLGAVTKVASSLPTSDGSHQPPALIAAAGIVPRAGAAAAAVAVAAGHPLAGVGLGLAPLALPAQLPAWSRDAGEVRAWLDSSKPALATTFAMIVRIPAETGLIGAALAAMALWRNLAGGGSATALVLMVATAAALVADGCLLASFAMVAPWVAMAAVRATQEPPRTDVADAHD